MGIDWNAVCVVSEKACIDSCCRMGVSALHMLPFQVVTNVPVILGGKDPFSECQSEETEWLGIPDINRRVKGHFTDCI